MRMLISGLVLLLASCSLADGSNESQIEAIIRKAPAEYQTQIQRVLGQFKGKESDGGTAITEKEFNTLKRLVDDLGGSESEPSLITRRADGNVSASDYLIKLKEIRTKIGGSDAASNARKCAELLSYLLSKAKGLIPNRAFIARTEAYMQIPSGLDLAGFDAYSEDDLNLINESFQWCRLNVSQYFTNFCPNCKGIMRFMVPIHIKQKVGDDTYLAHLRVAAVGRMTLSSQLLVLKTQKDQRDKGDQFSVGVYAGNESFVMQDGFDKKLEIAMELGPERVAALLCRFQQYAAFTKKKYKNRFQCGYLVKSDDFYGNGMAQLACAEVDADGAVKGDSAYYIHDFDFDSCK